MSLLREILCFGAILALAAPASLGHANYFEFRAANHAPLSSATLENLEKCKEVLSVPGNPQSSSKISCPPCGPLYCLNDPALPAAIAAKKAEMRARGYPDRLLQLIDRYKCVGCVRTAPDSFRITIEYAPGHYVKDSTGTWSHMTYPWTAQDEARARVELRQGTIKSFYISNSFTACTCCGEKPYYERPDYNSILEINTDGMYVYQSPSELGPDPPDLQNIPPNLLQDLPPIGSYTKPPRRQVHVMCPKCEALAEKYNTLAGQLDSLWDRAISLQIARDTLDRQIIDRENQIANLQYKLNVTGYSYEYQPKIDALEKLNETDSILFGADYDKLQNVLAQIADLTAQLAALAASILQCEKTECQTPSQTVQPPTPQPSINPAPTPCQPGQSCPPPTPCTPSTPGCTYQTPSGTCQPGQSCPPPTPCTPSTPGCTYQAPSGTCQPGQSCPPPTPCTPSTPGCTYQTPPGTCQPGANCTNAPQPMCTPTSVQPCTNSPTASTSPTITPAVGNPPANLPANLQPAAAQIYAFLNQIHNYQSPKAFFLNGAIQDLQNGMNSHDYAWMQTALSNIYQDLVNEDIYPDQPGLRKQVVGLQQALYTAQLQTFPPQWQPVASQTFHLVQLFQNSLSPKRMLVSGWIEDLLNGLNAQSLDKMQFALTQLGYVITQDMTQPGDPAPLAQVNALRTAVYDMQANTLPPQWQSIARQIFQVQIDVTSSYGPGRVLLETGVENLMNSVLSASPSPDYMQSELTSLIQTSIEHLWMPGDPQTVAKLVAIKNAIYQLQVQNLPPQWQTIGGQIFQVETNISRLPGPSYLQLSGAVEGLLTGLNARSISQVQTNLYSLQSDIQGNNKLQNPAVISSLNALSATTQQLAAQPNACAPGTPACNTPPTAGATKPGDKGYLDVKIPPQVITSVTPSSTGIPPESVAIDYSKIPFNYPPKKENAQESPGQVTPANDGAGGTTTTPPGTAPPPPNATVTKNADGSVSTTTTNPNGGTTTVINTLDGRTVTVTKNPDGSDVWSSKNPDGSGMTVTSHPDGSHTTDVTNPDGSTKSHYETPPNPPSAPAGGGTSLLPGTFNFATNAATTISNSLFGGMSVAPGNQLTVNGQTITIALAQPVTRRLGPNENPSASHKTKFGNAGQILPAAYHPSSRLPAPPVILRQGTASQSNKEAKVPQTFSFLLKASGELGSKALELQASDPSGQIKQVVIPAGVVLEPLKSSQAKPASSGGGGARPQSQQLTAYCLEIGKLPPEPGQLYRIAPQAQQDKFKPLKSILEAGSKLAEQGKFHPDSEPGAYNDFIRQHAMWAQQENWSEQKFTEVFLERTRKNAGEMKISWTKEMEQALKGAAPGRWRDISMVLEEARKADQQRGPGKPL